MRPLRAYRADSASVTSEKVATLEVTTFVFAHTLYN